MPLIFLSSLKDRIRCQRAKPFRVKFFTAAVAAAAADSTGSAVRTDPLPAGSGGGRAEPPTDRDRPTDRAVRQRAATEGGPDADADVLG